MMAGRIRSIKPEWIEDERLNACSDAAIRLTYVLLAMVDDEGRCRASVRALGLAGWKFCDRVIDKTAHAQAALEELLEAHWLIGYEADGYQHWQIRNFTKHQKISHFTPSKLPPPPDESGTNERAPENSGELRSVPESTGPLPPDHGSGSGSGSGEGVGARATAAAHVESFERSHAPVTEAHRVVATIISETRQAAGGAPFRGTGWQDRESVQKLAEWASAPDIGPERLRAALVAFWAGKGTGARLSWLTEEDPGRFLGQLGKKRSRIAPAGTRAEHEAAVAAAGGVGSAIIEI